MDKSPTIEERTSKTILQQPDEIKVGDKTYRVSPPSTATLILVSEMVSRLPHVNLDESHLVQESLHIAKDCALLGDIAAAIILGAKHINDPAEAQQKPSKWLKWASWRKPKHTATAKQALAKELLENLTPSELNLLAIQLIQSMQLGDFFGLTTFLCEINLIRPTKVVTDPTASGR